MPRKNPKGRKTAPRAGATQRSSRAARERHPGNWSLVVLQISNAGKKSPEGR
jgi:hypothetical protein